MSLAAAGTSVLAADPLFDDGVDAAVVGIVVLKVVVVFAVLLVTVMFYVWFMRKVIADMQNRIGPANAGPWGILQTLADGIKLFFKEQSIPSTADKPVFLLAPYLSLLPALLAFCVIPIGGEVSMFGRDTYLQVADPPIGVLFLLAMSGVGLYGVMLAGWSSGSKYPLMGSVRASAQLLSYEAALGLAIVGVLVQAGTLSTRGVVGEQAWDGAWSFFSEWFWAPAFVPLVIFVIAGLAEINHPPFDLVEAEQELVGGFHTEYTGIRFAIFFLAEFMNVVTMSAICVTLFFGGPSGPGLGFLPADGVVNTWLVPVFWFTLKVLVLLFCTVWVRASLPRLRYDQLMSLGWKVLIELAILWVLVSAFFVVARSEDWPVWTYFAAVAGAALAYLVLYLSMPKRGELVEEVR